MRKFLRKIAEMLGIHNYLYLLKIYYNVILPLKINYSPLIRRIRSERNVPLWDSLEIEINSFCNRDCPWCPRYSDRTGVRKDSTGKSIKKAMSSEAVYMIIDQAYSLGYRGKVCLHRLSEPFVDLRYIEFAQYVKKKGMHLSEDTNGDYLKNNPNLCAELDGLLTNLHIGLYDYKNDEEKLQQIEFWQNRFKKTNITFSIPREMCSVRINSILDGNKRVAKESFCSWLPCYMPATKFLIRYDGYISLCCEDDLCSFDLGNVFEQKLEEIWWSPRRVAITTDLLKIGGRRKFTLCRKCHLGQLVNYDTLFGS